MPHIEVIRETELSKSMRARQLSSIFDVPLRERMTQKWTGELPIENEDWSVGLFVGPSGAGKSTILREYFGEPLDFAWSAPSVIDDFGETLGIQDIADACTAVGFNTIPAWLRPFDVLSTGEKFRVTLARALLEGGDPLVVDEFTSVVDRQVAQIGANAVQKHIRAHGHKFVAASCHYDIVDWLQPDWTFEPHSMTFTRRSLQRRPPVDVVIGRVPYAAWHTFAPFHYLTAEMNRSAKCWGLWADGHLASFCSVLPRPASRSKPGVLCPYGFSRHVTLPDWQGLGLIMRLVETVAAAFKTYGRPIRTYPAHPMFVRQFDRSAHWELETKPGSYRPTGRTSQFGGPLGWNPGSRPCATFRFIGPRLSQDDAQKMLGGVYKKWT